jgi:hypothetical protein
MRSALARANSIGSSSPSGSPFAMATEELLVAMALAPPSAMARALPASHALKRTSGSPAMWSAAKARALSMWVMAAA